MHRRPPRDRSRARLAPVALLLLTAAAARAQPSSCQFSAAAVGATFDLSPLRLPASSTGYTVGAGFASQNYSYTFNLCDSLGREPAPSCVEVPPAPTIGPAYQLSSDRQQCFRLGASAAAPNVQWSLLGARQRDDCALRLIPLDCFQSLIFIIFPHDCSFLRLRFCFRLLCAVYVCVRTAAQDPAAGVSVTYLNGAKCGAGAQAFARQLTLRLRCDATATSVSQLSAERVQETSTCHYSLDVATVFACPRGVFARVAS